VVNQPAAQLPTLDSAVREQLRSFLEAYSAAALDPLQRWTAEQLLAHPLLGLSQLPPHHHHGAPEQHQAAQGSGSEELTTTPASPQPPVAEQLQEQQEQVGCARAAAGPG
jgi:hypothetical protein